MQEFHIKIKDSYVIEYLSLIITEIVDKRNLLKFIK